MQIILMYHSCNLSQLDPHMYCFVQIKGYIIYNFGILTTHEMTYTVH